MIERMATRTTAVHGDPGLPPAAADQQREDALRSRIRRLLASGALHRRPWHLSTRLRPVAGGPSRAWSASTPQTRPTRSRPPSSPWRPMPSPVDGCGSRKRWKRTSRQRVS